MTIYDKIYKACKEFYEGKEYKPLSYNLRHTETHFEPELYANMQQINNLLRLLWNNKIAKIEYTPKGHIKKHNIHHTGCAYSIQEIRTDNHVFKALKVVIIVKNTVFRFNFGYKPNDKDITGNQAFKEFCKSCKKHNINLEDYAIDNGLEVKADIQSPIIRNYIKHKRLENVHHLDLNQAWPSELCKIFPEFKPVIADLRQKNKLYSDIAFGVMQSQYAGYKWAHFARTGINGCNDTIKAYAAKLMAAGNTIVGINTDGIWYKGDIYHDENEGTELGQWKTDHKNCIFYADNNGSYYFIEDGKVNIRLRGPSAYDKVKPDRTTWTEDDYFNAIQHMIELQYIEGYGFIQQ